MSRPETASKFLRLPAVLELVGFSRPTLYRRIESGDFPKPVKLGYISVWPEQAVIAWQQQKMAL